MSHDLPPSPDPDGLAGGTSAADVDTVPSEPRRSLPRPVLDDEFDLVERQRQAMNTAGILGQPFEPIRIGRFVLVGKAGKGGMGTVYVVYDEELARKVAVKFLHRADDDQATHRLLREAQALARLSHEHLVAVYDVGRFEGRVYLAMELVEGTTMTDWTHRPRPWRQVLQHWLDVADALVAVHDAGLVHRDIKPHNVLVGNDGRARLVDFGLARGGLDDDSSSTPRQHGHVSDTDVGSRLSEGVTHSRTMVGTPPYMAPETRSGEPATAAADQYSLCVSIYESLCRQRPAGPTRDGELVDTPQHSPIPLAIRRALSIGLALGPHQRHPSVAALARALRRSLGQRRRRIATGLGALALGIAAGLGGLLHRALTPPVPAPAAQRDPCADVARAIESAWDPERRDALSTTLQTTDIPFAAVLAAETTARLDAFASTWAQTRYEVCRATHVEHVQSMGLLDRRMQCLDEQQLHLRTLVDELLAITPARARRTIDGIAALPSPDDCALPGLARSTFAPPAPGLQPAVDTLRATITSLSVRMTLDSASAVEPALTQALREAEALGYPPLVADAALQLGRLHAKRLDATRARPVVERAVNVAEAHQDLLLKERALHIVLMLAVDVGGDLAAAQRAYERYAATVQALGSRPRYVMRMHLGRARVQRLAGDLAAAEASVRAGLDQVAPEDSPPGYRSDALVLLATVLLAQGKTNASIEAFARSREFDAAWGADLFDPRGRRRWPGLADQAESKALIDAGHLDRARELLEQTLETQRRVYGPRSLPVALTLVAQVDLALHHGDIASADVLAREADAIMLRWLDPRHELRTGPLSAVGAVAFEHARYPDALRAFTQMLEIETSVRAPGSLDVAVAHNNVGETLLIMGRATEARGHLQVALAGMRAHVEPTDLRLAFPLKALAELSLAKGEIDAAASMLEEALAVHEHASSHPREHARTQWVLARTRAAQGRATDARRLAEQALATLAELDRAHGSGTSPSQDERDAIAAWLAATVDDHDARAVLGPPHDGKQP